MTVAHALAIAVLKGDMIAALALADKVREEATDTQQTLVDRCEEVFQSPVAADGFNVYTWPEFQAFCKRAGFMWNLRTRDVVITIKEGHLLLFNHEYVGTDLPGPTPAPHVPLPYHNPIIESAEFVGAGENDT